MASPSTPPVPCLSFFLLSAACRRHVVLPLHEDAAACIPDHDLPLPGNCMVPGRPPKLLGKSTGSTEGTATRHHPLEVSRGPPDGNVLLTPGNPGRPPQPIPPRDFRAGTGDCIGMECLVRFDAATL